MVWLYFEKIKSESLLPGFQNDRRLMKVLKHRENDSLVTITLHIVKC